MEYKISKESVDKVYPKKFTGYVELTDADLLDAKLSLEDFIWEAHKTALHNGIRANAVMINKRIVKTSGFAHAFAGGFMDIPPMICGLEAYVTAEIPNEFAFGLVEVPMTQREKVYREGYEQGAKDIAEKIKKYYKCLGSMTNPCTMEYYIDQVLKESFGSGEECLEKR
jgi:hypothetical protein